MTEHADQADAEEDASRPSASDPDSFLLSMTRREPCIGRKAAKLNTIRLVYSSLMWGLRLLISNEACVRRRILLCLTIFLACASLLVPISEASPDIGYGWLLDQIDADRAWDIVRELAGNTYEGRLSGTWGATLASEYVAHHFQTIGLKPGGQDGAYRTRFSVPMWRLTTIPTLGLADESGDVAQYFQYRTDFYVQPGSDSGDYLASVVFVGYGITAANLNYDDYANVSVRGRIVLAMSGVPSHARFGETYEAWYTKAENAQTHGAVGLLLVDDPTKPTPYYIRKWIGGRGVYDGLTILRGSIPFADTLLKDSGETLSSIQQRIDQELKPRSFSLNSRLWVSVHVSFARTANGYNVLGFIPGSDPTASHKIVIVGAHYDHLGKDVDGSIFAGANDNASGVAVMMEIARLFSSQVRPRYSVMFAAWGGEEEGLYGSYAYVDDPSFSLSDTIGYLNLDMVGYGQQLRCSVLPSHDRLRSVIAESGEQLGISLDFGEFGGRSDHVPFRDKDVQSAMLIYWPDDQYHTPLDTADRVLRENLLKTARLTSLVVLKLSEAEAVQVTATTGMLTATETIALSGSRTETARTGVEQYQLELATLVVVTLSIIVVMIVLRSRRTGIAL